MKAKTESKETYPLSEKQFKQFAKALVAVPKKAVDKEIAQEQRHRRTTSKTHRKS